ncbi:hypothetical protein ACFWXZ_14400 [[Kitasatospora] papulosa]|uniref:hypothetical protein n=1 Tax=[Kitasatospora] papulosa TaxID=1464011 RepID=UPI0036B5D343
MTTPTDTARLALDDMAATLDRLRTALADAYGRAGAALADAGNSVAAAEERAEQAEAERDELHEALGLAPGQLHSAALSAIRGRAANIRELTARAELAEHRATQWEAARHTWKAKAQEIEADRDMMEDSRDSAIRAREQAQQDAAAQWTRADALDRMCREHRARADNAAEELAERSKRDGRTEATLQRVRDAATLAQALAAVAEHDGLTPAQAAASAAFAAAAEKPAAVEAEREREHAIRLAAVEQARAEAVRVADRATSTLLRIRHARTAADAWVILGEHYHMHSTEAGRAARRWRTTAEHITDRHRRNLAAVFALSAETPFEDIREYAAKTLTRSGERLLAAEKRATAVRQYVTDAYADDMAQGIRDDITRILDGQPTTYASTAEPVTCEVSWHVHQETAPTTTCRRSAPEEG